MNRQIDEVLTEAAHQNGVEKEEIRWGVSETWKYICESPHPSVRKFGLSLMEGNTPPPPGKIAVYLTLLTLLYTSAPLVNEPNTEKRMDMAMEKIIKLHQAGRL